ncbi:MAG: hypothetical protein M3N43_06455 [Actinomycetota bacterium]|nr:hypothetical protein [Actinomycetota bacterium]
MTATMGQVMDAIGVQLATISGLRVYDFPPKSAQAPFAFVDMPETIRYDQTYGRGSDRMTLQVVVGVASQVDRASRDQISGYADGTVVKAAIEATTLCSCRVTQVSFGAIQLAASTFLGATFEVDVSA